MEEKELWMNKLKEKLADYSEPVPASGWEQLEKEVSAQSSFPTSLSACPSTSLYLSSSHPSSVIHH